MSCQIGFYRRRLLLSDPIKNETVLLTQSMSAKNLKACIIRIEYLLNAGVLCAHDCILCHVEPKKWT